MQTNTNYSRTAGFPVLSQWEDFVPSQTTQGLRPRQEQNLCASPMGLEFFFPQPSQITTLANPHRIVRSFVLFKQVRRVNKTCMLYFTEKLMSISTCPFQMSSIGGFPWKRSLFIRMTIKLVATYGASWERYWWSALPQSPSDWGSWHISGLFGRNCHQRGPSRRCLPHSWSPSQWSA